MRRELLAQAVEDNLHLIAGTRPERQRRPRGAGGRLLGLALLASIAVGAAFALSASWPPAGVDAPAAAEARPTARGAVSPGRRPAPEPLSAAVAARRLTAGSLDSRVFPVGVRRIVLDPGHGGRDVGTVTPEGLQEKELALDIALRLRDLLAADGGLEVVLTRSDDRHVLLRERARIANQADADLFVSIHLNWLEPRGSSGIETYYLGPTDDPYLVRLTGRENHDSGYSLGDVRRLLDSIYLDLRQEESQRLAASVQGSLYESLSAQTPELRDRGVRSAPFLVLVTTDMPAILAEVSCLSNEREAELLATPAYRQKIAEALEAGIARYREILAHIDAKES
ncbi:MAG TPA: N-acetylmuramoyl-L-alanine amidase [Thermoanaerobaculia bacterium]|nr:N-acetylmuramoyl-L-alanine amidase [Thermoanaerobaculia bacterium]